MPRTLAAVDVGSNAIRLSMVRLCPSGVLLDNQSHRYALRLGAEVYRHGYVRETVARSFLEVFRDIALRMRDFGVEERRVVATASLRDASNRDELTTRVWNAYGIHIDVITGDEESTLARSALVRALGFLDPSSLLIDLGGGSLELMSVDGHPGVSLPLGTVRLLEQFPSLRGACSVDAVTEARRAALEVLATAELPRQPERCIGTGGNLGDLARLLPGPVGLWPTVDLARLDDLIVELSRLDGAERVVRYGVRPDRADVLLPVAVVLSALRQRFGLGSVVVPGTGIREAILQRLAAAGHGDLGLDSLLESASSDPRPARARARLAIALFQMLSPVHGLWPSALSSLVLAAYGWELGQTINVDDPLRHGAYLIRHSRNLPVDKLTRAVAATAYRHSLGGRAYSRSLSGEQRRAARVLGAIVELAGRVEPEAKPEDLRADLTGSRLWLAVGLSAKRRWHRLERALGRRMEIR